MKGGMEGMKGGMEGMKGGMEGRDGGDEGRDGGEGVVLASSLFVIASLSCFIASFSPCPPRMSLLTCPRCRVVFAWVIRRFLVRVSRWWWFSCVVAAVSVWASVGVTLGCCSSFGWSSSFVGSHLRCMGGGGSQAVVGCRWRWVSHHWPLWRLLSCSCCRVLSFGHLLVC